MIIINSGDIIVIVWYLGAIISGSKQCKPMWVFVARF